jgi:hypothetical protein
MYPQAYLKTFWRMELQPKVFVAMSFAPAYESRFDDVIKPAINAIQVNGKALSAHRVDLSKTGDSILTEIMDGIAHSQLVLADVSSIGKDSVSGRPYRNANVLYEVGLALACRHSSEVLLVRDDRDPFLFDVSVIPHSTIDFTDCAKAKQAIVELLLARLEERNLLNDARVQLAIKGISYNELEFLELIAGVGTGQAWGANPEGSVMSTYEHAICRLIDKGLIVQIARFPEGHPAYTVTELGRIVANHFAATKPTRPTGSGPETP